MTEFTSPELYSFTFGVFENDKRTSIEIMIKPCRILQFVGLDKLRLHSMVVDMAELAHEAMTENKITFGMERSLLNSFVESMAVYMSASTLPGGVNDEDGYREVGLILNKDGNVWTINREYSVLLDGLDSVFYCQFDGVESPTKNKESNK